MSWRPTATLAALRQRAAHAEHARAFFARRGVLEVETPILSAAAVSDPQIESLATQIAGLPGRRYLCPSPEYAMKRLLAAGSGDIYQICKVFRDAERGRWHNPEFTMLEWYRVGLRRCGADGRSRGAARRAAGAARALGAGRTPELLGALRRHAGVDAFDSSEDELLRRGAARMAFDCEAELDRDAKLDLLMGLIVGPRLGRERPCFICDYPASQASLARLKPGLPRGGGALRALSGRPGTRQRLS